MIRTVITKFWDLKGFVTQGLSSGTEPEPEGASAFLRTKLRMRGLAARWPVLSRWRKEVE